MPDLRKAVAKLMPSQQVEEMHTALHNARYFLTLAGLLWDNLELITEFLTPDEIARLNEAGRIYAEIQEFLSTPPEDV